MKSFYIFPADSKNLKLLEDAITDYNVSVSKDLPKAIIKRLDFVVEDANGQLMGGIQAMTVNWGILQVDLIYIFEEYRKTGVGTFLLNYVENIAIENSCTLSHLDTFDFQAKNFYLKQEYEIFGILKDCPQGHERYYMKKNLRPLKT